jgi:hypothetical protein
MMKNDSTRNTTKLLINLALLGLFVLLGIISFQANSATGEYPARAQVEQSR